MEQGRWVWVRWLTLGSAVVLLALVAGCVGARIRDGGGSSDSVDGEGRLLLLDTFSTERGQLGLLETETGQRWRQVGGAWRVRNGLAIGSGHEGATIASVDPRTALGFVQVVVERMVPNSGVVFRFRDVSNYWALVAAPGVLRWNLVKIVNGETSTVDSFGPARVAAGALLVIRLDGDRIEIEIDGSVVGSADDPDLADSYAVGLVVPPGARASFNQIIGSSRPSTARGLSTPSTVSRDIDQEAAEVAGMLTGSGEYSVVGDSVTFDARQELEAEGAQVSAFGGVNIQLGRDRLRALARSQHRQIVIELGQMDVSRGVDERTISDGIDAVFRHDVRSVPCVIWLDLPVGSNVIPGWSERAEAYNRDLRSLADRHGRHVVAWSQMAASHPEWLRDDGIHLNDDGQRGYAQFIADSVNDLC